MVPFGIDGLVLDSAGIPHPWVEAHLAPSYGKEIIVLKVEGSGQPAGKGAFLGAKFETGNDDYEWLNYVVAIGRSKIDDPKNPTFASLELFKVSERGNVEHVTNVTLLANYAFYSRWLPKLRDAIQEFGLGRLLEFRVSLSLLVFFLSFFWTVQSIATIRT